ncbi:unnamed protein product [Symbiodinium natans]|uniref:Uncharacterized protein n=1 Tax=Symbiodinium natans TaxID=878477 RepID=A0A812SEE9_9DINO|nr:unnamed protein product [Symbiodinium natans]
MAMHQPSRCKVIPEHRSEDSGTTDRAPPALLGKALRTDDCDNERDLLDPFGLPYIRPSHHVSQAESLARGQFPTAAKQILHDLRHGVHDSKRRASDPAIHSQEFSGGHARKRATICTDNVEMEHPFAVNGAASFGADLAATWGPSRREEALSPGLLSRFSLEGLEGVEGAEGVEPVVLGVPLIELQEPPKTLEETLKEAKEAGRKSQKALAKQSSRISVATSSMRWRQPECTLIIVDWDDTMFPTTWLQQKGWFAQWVTCGKLGTFMERDELTIPPNDLALISELDTVLEAFLLSACALGQVSCVTLARRPWQDRTMRAFLPKLSSAWDKHFVVVRYAREERLVQTDDCGFTPLDKQDLEMVRQGTFAKKKQKSMERLLRKFYKKGSWKNVISLGDGPAERQALQEIGFRHLNPASPKTGEQKTFRTKTVKMLEEPDCSELVAELQMVQAWLPALASTDEDIDIDLAEGEEALLDVHQQLMDVVESGSRSSSPVSSVSSPRCAPFPAGKSREGNR